MENIVLTIHLILALALVGIVLLQRSEGGGLGLGGGGGGDGIMSGRGTATALSKITWLLASVLLLHQCHSPSLLLETQTHHRFSIDWGVKAKVKK
ncbi:MAG: hypothetical protein CM15mP85_16650 [Rhodobacterales bacterium]|nr:MAG: hypothetical protein CM15mP85_16650 [Rhodobacterales bacterium]